MDSLVYEITLGNASSVEIQLNEYRLQPSVATDSDCVHWSLEEPLHWWEPGLLSLVWANMVAGAIAVITFVHHYCRHQHGNSFAVKLSSPAVARWPRCCLNWHPRCSRLQTVPICPYCLLPCIVYISGSSQDSRACTVTLVLSCRQSHGKLVPTYEGDIVFREWHHHQLLDSWPWFKTRSAIRSRRKSLVSSMLSQ